MLPKKNRVSAKEVDLIFAQGKFAVSSSLTFKYLVKAIDQATSQTCGNSHMSDLWPCAKGVKISFIAPKSAAKLAVKRNLLRRRGYSALEKYLDQFPSGIIGVFIFKKYQDDISTLENEIKTILGKIN